METSWENIYWVMKYILLLYRHYLALHGSQLGKIGLRTELQAFKNTSSPVTEILLKYNSVFGLGFLSFTVQTYSLIPLYLFFKSNSHDFESFLKVRREKYQILPQSPTV